MSDNQRKAYIDSTHKRSARKKVRPSLQSHRDMIRDCVRGDANMRVVFDDLLAIDPSVGEDFGDDGHRRFNAAAKRMVDDLPPRPSAPRGTAP